MPEFQKQQIVANAEFGNPDARFSLFPELTDVERQILSDDLPIAFKPF